MGQWRALIGPTANILRDPLWGNFLQENSHPDDMKVELRVRALQDKTDTTGHGLEKKEEASKQAKRHALQPK
jgi:hypothetical protein